MSMVLMVDVPNASEENIRRGIIQTITAFLRHRERRDDLDVMGNAILVEWGFVVQFMDPEDYGAALISGPLPGFGVKFFGHFMGIPLFATGDAVHKTNGLIGWNLDRVGGIEEALRHFYATPLIGGCMMVDMSGYREPEVFIPGFVPARQIRNYIDMEDVVREMEV